MAPTVSDRAPPSGPLPRARLFGRRRRRKLYPDFFSFSSPPRPCASWRAPPRRRRPSSLLLLLRGGSSFATATCSSAPSPWGPWAPGIFAGLAGSLFALAAAFSRRSLALFLRAALAACAAFSPALLHERLLGGGVLGLVEDFCAWDFTWVKSRVSTCCAIFVRSKPRAILQEVGVLILRPAVGRAVLARLRASWPWAPSSPSSPHGGLRLGGLAVWRTWWRMRGAYRNLIRIELWSENKQLLTANARIFSKTRK